MVAMGAIQTAKEMMVGEVVLSYKYKYNAGVMQVDATWDIQPRAAASPTMWVGIFKQGAPLTEVRAVLPLHVLRCCGRS
jgi:hypothetical protein